MFGEATPPVDPRSALELGRRQANHGLFAEALEIFLLVAGASDPQLRAHGACELFIMQYLLGQPGAPGNLVAAMKSAGGNVFQVGSAPLGFSEHPRLFAMTTALSIAACMAKVDGSMQKHGDAPAPADTLSLDRMFGVMHQSLLHHVDYADYRDDLLEAEEYAYCLALGAAIRKAKEADGPVDEDTQLNLISMQAQAATDMLVCLSAETHLLEMLLISDRLGLSDWLVWSHENLAALYEEVGSYAMAAAHYAKLHDCRRAVGDEASLSALLMAANCLAYEGDFAAGFGLAERARLLAENSRNPRDAIDLHTVLGNLHVAAGQLVRGETCFRHACDLARQALAADRLILGGVLHQLALLEIKRNRVGDAQKYATEVARLTSCGTSWHHYKANLLLARVAVESGQREDAERILRDVLHELLSEYGGDHVRSIAPLCLLSEIVSDSTVASRLLARASSVAERFVFRNSVLWTQIATAQEHLGRRDR